MNEEKQIWSPLCLPGSWVTGQLRHLYRVFALAIPTRRSFTSDFRCGTSPSYLHHLFRVSLELLFKLCDRRHVPQGFNFSLLQNGKMFSLTCPTKPFKLLGSSNEIRYRKVCWSLSGVEPVQLLERRRGQRRSWVHLSPQLRVLIWKTRAQEAQGGSQDTENWALAHTGDTQGETKARRGMASNEQVLPLTRLIMWSEVALLSRVRLFATLWTIAYQAPPSMGFSKQEYWSELPFPSPGDIPDPGIEPRSPIL